MEQKNYPRQEVESPENILSRYSAAPWLRFYSILAFLAVGLIPFTSCKKDDDKSDEEYAYGTVELLKEGGRLPLWSPDGERIAYKMNGELHVMNSDGSGNLLLTTEYEGMKWSPFGTELAYHTYRDGPLAIYKIGRDGNNEVKLTGFEVSIMDMDFSWSPDGGKIAYGVSALDKVDLYIMNSDGSGNHKVDIPITVFSPSFTPGGSRIMFNSIIDIVERDLFLVGTDGSNLQRLKSPNISVGHAEMKGDESKIYFSGDSGMNNDIYEVYPDGSNLKNLTNGVGSSSKPHISPDGKYIAFIGSRDDNFGLWIMHADGSNASRISKGVYLFSPGSWSPDSRKFVFEDTMDWDTFNIYVLTLK